MPITFVAICIGLGVFCVVWLILDIRQERRRDQRNRDWYTSDVMPPHVVGEWRTADEDERERLKAAAIWKGYKRP